MSEESKNNQPISSQPVEDVFSSVEETAAVSTSPVSQAPTPTNLNISESSIGQEEPMSPVSEEKTITEPVVPNEPEEKNQAFNTGKILFYFILFLIVLLGAFAIWALVF